MWEIRQNATTGRWEVYRGDVIDSASWLTEGAALGRATTMNAELARQRAGGDQGALLAAGGETGRAWYAVLAVDDYMEASESRYFERFEWAEPLPLPLLTLDTNEGGGHYGAESSGSIETIERLSDGRRIFASGHFAPTDEGENTATLVESGALRFISVDPADYDVDEEITVIGSDGWPLEGRLRFTSYTIGGATVVPFPAIRLATIWLDGMDAPAELTEPLPDPVARVQIPEIRDVGEDTEIIVIMASGAPEGAVVGGEWEATIADTDDNRVLLASARAELREAASCLLTDDCGGPVLPPEDWFTNPALSGPTRGVVRPSGQIFGHLALWSTPHRGVSDGRVGDRFAPHSLSGYSEFMTNATTVACCDEPGCGHERRVIPTGVLTIGTTHAQRRLSAVAAQAHYENTGNAVADVVIGEDEHGIWYAGALRPGVDDVKVRTFLGSSPSGDWRKRRGHLELCAVLMVNMPGFPITASGYDEDGDLSSLILGLPAEFAPESDDVLLASLAGRPGRRGGGAAAIPARIGTFELSALTEGRLARLERDMAALLPLVADRLDTDLAAVGVIGQ